MLLHNGEDSRGRIIFTHYQVFDILKDNDDDMFCVCNRLNEEEDEKRCVWGNAALANVLIDEIEEKMDVVTREIQTNNMKLKGVLNQVRTTRKFFIDIILICILLAVGLYIYNMFA